MKYTASLINYLTSVPFLGYSLRWIARRYPEGSVITISIGRLSGYQWKRSHNYVSSYWLGTYEPQVQNCLIRELKPGDIFYDIGANAGFFSLLGSKLVGNKGHVYSFEPLPQNIIAYKNQCKANLISNSTLVEMAVSDHVGEVKLFEGDTALTATIMQDVYKNNKFHLVKALTFDEFIKTAPPPDFIKIDVEGAEILVLEGAHFLLGSENPPKLLIEIHGKDVARSIRCILEHEKKYFLYSLEGEKIESDSIPRHILALPANS